MVKGHLSSAVVQAAHCVTVSAATCFVDVLAPELYGGCLCL